MDYTSIFKDLTKQTQIRIDAASRLKKQLFDTNYYERYLDWDIPTIGLNFQALIGQYGISVAAATLDSKGKEPIMGVDGLQTIQEKVLSHKMTVPMTIDEYRLVLQLLDSKSIPDETKKSQLVNLMWGNVEKVVKSVQSKLDIIFLGALSNKGVFTFDNTNNPEGGVNGTVDYKMPTENIASVTTEWTAGNLSKVDCFQDIQDVVDKASDKVKFEKILMSPARLSFMLKNSNLKKAVFGTDKSSTPLLLSGLNEFLRMNEMPIIETVRRSTRIQNNGVITEYNPWNDKQLVFVPAGKLGVIKNAFTDNELRPEPGVTYSNYGRIRVSQWGKGETDNSNGVEFTKAESLSLPIITEINGIYSLSVES